MLIGEQTTSPAQTDIILTDALGSVLISFSNTSNHAALLDNQDYGPYGTQRYQQGSMGTTKGFTGQYADTTGLDYYNARYYDPVVGVFLSADTVQGNVQGLNPYGYVNGNPESRSDPTGQHVVCGDTCGGGGSQGYQGHGAGRGPVSSCQAQDDCTDDGGASPSPNNTQLQHDATHYIHGTVLTFLNSGLQGLLYLSLYDHHALVMQEATDWAVLEQLWQEAEAILVQQGIDWNASGAMELLHEKLIALTVPLLIMYTGGGFDHHVDLSGSIDGVGADGGGVDPSGDSSGGFCSFTPQTLVATTKGEQPIGTLQVGEKVRAYNPTTHTMDLEAVLHVWIHQDTDLVDLTITTTTTVRHGSALTTTTTREVIHTNQKHPFFTIEQGFLAVSHITIGMHLLRADGRVRVVTGWKVVAGTKVMYNLEVAQDHTFTVGEGMWVVHNSDGCGSNDPITYSTEPKIDKQMVKRGWTPDMINESLNNPVRTIPWQDTRYLSGGGRVNDPATAYYYRGGGYVVRNNVTGDIVQVSDRNDPGWMAPWDATSNP